MFTDDVEPCSVQTSVIPRGKSKRQEIIGSILSHEMQLVFHIYKSCFMAEFCCHIDLELILFLA